MGAKLWNRTKLKQRMRLSKIPTSRLHGLSERIRTSSFKLPKLAVYHWLTPRYSNFSSLSRSYSCHKDLDNDSKLFKTFLRLCLHHPLSTYLLSFGTRSELRSHTPCGTAFWELHVYQFHHSGIFKNANDRARTYNFLVRSEVLFPIELRLRIFNS